MAVPEQQKLGNWAIVPGPGHHGETLLVGRRRLALAQVDRVAMGEVAESDIAGKLVTFALFMGLAAVMVLGVALGWRTRVLIGAAVVAAIGLTAGFEAFRAGKARFFRVDIRLRSGETVQFATPSRELARALAEAVHARLGPRTA